jgi:hypothetical protein
VTTSDEAVIMSGKPYQSKLNPHIRRIAELRRTRPPTPYKEIANILNKEHPELNVSHNAVWAFVKARSKGRKVAYLSLEDEPIPAAPEPVQIPVVPTTSEEPEDIYDRARKITLSQQQTTPKPPANIRPETKL